MERPEIVSLARTHAVAVWRNVVIQIWEEPLAPADQLRGFLETRRAFQTLEPSTGPDRPLLAITIVSERTSMPDSESRAIAASFSTYFDYYVGVHEGTGFRASLVRAVVAGMSLMAKDRAAHDICGSLSQGAALLAARGKRTVSAEEVVQVVTDLRARIASAPPPG